MTIYYKGHEEIDYNVNKKLKYLIRYIFIFIIFDQRM